MDNEQHLKTHHSTQLHHVMRASEGSRNSREVDSSENDAHAKKSKKSTHKAPNRQKSRDVQRRTARTEVPSFHLKVCVLEAESSAETDSATEARGAEADPKTSLLNESSACANHCCGQGSLAFGSSLILCVSFCVALLLIQDTKAQTAFITVAVFFVLSFCATTWLAGTLDLTEPSTTVGHWSWTEAPSCLYVPQTLDPVFLFESAFALTFFVLYAENELDRDRALRILGIATATLALIALLTVIGGRYQNQQLKALRILGLYSSEFSVLLCLLAASGIEMMNGIFWVGVLVPAVFVGRPTAILIISALIKLWNLRLASRFLTVVSDLSSSNWSNFSTWHGLNRPRWRHRRVDAGITTFVQKWAYNSEKDEHTLHVKFTMSLILCVCWASLLYAFRWPEQMTIILAILLSGTFCRTSWFAARLECNPNLMESHMKLDCCICKHNREEVIDCKYDDRGNFGHRFVNQFQAILSSNQHALMLVFVFEAALDCLYFIKLARIESEYPSVLSEYDRVSHFSWMCLAGITSALLSIALYLNTARWGSLTGSRCSDIKDNTNTHWLLRMFAFVLTDAADIVLLLVAVFGEELAYMVVPTVFLMVNFYIQLVLATIGHNLCEMESARQRKVFKKFAGKAFWMYLFIFDVAFPGLISVRAFYSGNILSILPLPTVMAVVSVVMYLCFSRLQNNWICEFHILLLQFLVVFYFLGILLTSNDALCMSHACRLDFDLFGIAISINAELIILIPYLCFAGLPLIWLCILFFLRWRWLVSRVKILGGPLLSAEFSSLERNFIREESVRKFCERRHTCAMRNARCSSPFECNSAMTNGRAVLCTRRLWCNVFPLVIALVGLYSLTLSPGSSETLLEEGLEIPTIILGCTNNSLDGTPTIAFRLSGWGMEETSFDVYEAPDFLRYVDKPCFDRLRSRRPCYLGVDFRSPVRLRDGAKLICEDDCGNLSRCFDGWGQLMTGTYSDHGVQIGVLRQDSANSSTSIRIVSYHVESSQVRVISIDKNKACTIAYNVQESAHVATTPSKGSPGHAKIAVCANQSLTLYSTSGNRLNTASMQCERIAEMFVMRDEREARGNDIILALLHTGYGCGDNYLFHCKRELVQLIANDDGTFHKGLISKVATASAYTHTDPGSHDKRTRVVTSAFVRAKGAFWGVGGVEACMFTVWEYEKGSKRFKRRKSWNAPCASLLYPITVSSTVEPYKLRHVLYSSHVFRYKILNFRYPFKLWSLD